MGKSIFFVVFLFLIAGVSILLVMNTSGPKKPYVEKLFTDNEILVPDMVHSDTLKVINADLLNRLIPACDGTDYELNEVLMLGCDVVPEDKYNSRNMMRDYQIELHMDTLWVWDYKRLVGKYITNWKNQIDSILLKDNL
jgi:hypothetical protein